MSPAESGCSSRWPTCSASCCSTRSRGTGAFCADYVESEKENLIDAIESILNDKRDYADARLLQEMCRGERYGIRPARRL